MTIKLSNRLRIRPCVTPQDITIARTGAWIDVSGAQEMLVAVTTGPVAAGSTVTVQLLQALDALGTGSKALGPPVVATAPAGGSPLTVTVDAHVNSMDQNGFAFVAAVLSSNNGSAVQAGAVAVLGNNRFNP